MTKTYKINGREVSGISKWDKETLGVQETITEMCQRDLELKATITAILEALSDKEEEVKMYYRKSPETNWEELEHTKGRIHPKEKPCYKEEHIHTKECMEGVENAVNNLKSVTNCAVCTGKLKEDVCFHCGGTGLHVYEEECTCTPMFNNTVEDTSDCKVHQPKQEECKHERYGLKSDRRGVFCLKCDTLLGLSEDEYLNGNKVKQSTSLKEDRNSLKYQVSYLLWNENNFTKEETDRYSDQILKLLQSHLLKEVEKNATIAGAWDIEVLDKKTLIKIINNIC